MPMIRLDDLRKDMERDARKLAKRAREWHRLKPTHWGFPTGLPQLDTLVGGMTTGKLIVLAGGPGSGKTSLAMQALIAAAEHTVTHPEEMSDNTLHVFVSAEMSRVEVMQRTACSRAGINLDDLRRGLVADDQLDSYEQELTYLCGLPLLVVDSAEPFTAEDVRILVSSLLQEDLTLGVVAVDYLQQLNDEGANDTIRINGMLRKLIHVKQHSECCLLLLSQYSRGKLREKREPTMEDLLGSGNIERAADQIWAIHDPNNGFTEVAPGVVRKELFVLKNRSGRKHKPGDRPITLDFYEAQTLFVDPTELTVADMDLVNGIYLPHHQSPRSVDEEPYPSPGLMVVR